MALAVHDPTLPLIELPLLHEARIPPSELFVLGLFPYDIVVLDHRIPCRLVPETSVNTGQLHVAEHTLRALVADNSRALPSPVAVTITTLTDLVKVQATNASTESKLDEAQMVQLIELSNYEANFVAEAIDFASAGGIGAVQTTNEPNRSLSRHLARVWRGLHVAEGCVLFSTVHGKVCCYRVCAVKSIGIDSNDRSSWNDGLNHSSGSSIARNGSKKWCTIDRNTTVVLMEIDLGNKHGDGVVRSDSEQSAIFFAKNSTSRLGLAREPFAGALDELFSMLRLAMQSTSEALQKVTERKCSSTAISESAKEDISNSTSGSGSMLLPRGALVAGPPGSGKSALVALLAAEIERIGLARSVRVFRISGLDLVLDPDPRAVLRQTRTAAQTPISHSSASRYERPASRNLSLVIIDDMDNLLAAFDDSQDGNEDNNEGNTCAGPQERMALAVLKAFLDDLASDQAAAAAAENLGAEFGGSMPVVFVVGVGSSSSSSGSSGSRPGAAAGLLRVGRMERLIQLPPPSEADRAAVCNALLRRASLCSFEEEKIAGGQEWELARRVAAATPGFVARDLVRLIDAAQLFALGRRSNSGSNNDRVGGLAWADIQAALVDVKPSELAELDVRRFPTKEQGGPSWDDFGGYPSLKAQVLRAVLGPWQAPEVHAALGVPSLSGALLHGPSGCGKSLLATIIAAECRANFVHVRSTELLSKWLGESERLVRRLFARARAAAPCVLFFDDLDALFGKRDLEGGGSGGASGGVEQRLLTTFLNELDGVGGGAGSRGVLVLAATNRPLHCLDAALLRPGRLHESLEVGCPQSTEDRAAVLHVHLQGLPLSQCAPSENATSPPRKPDGGNEGRTSGVQGLEQSLQGLALRDEPGEKSEKQPTTLNSGSGGVSSPPSTQAESTSRALAQSLAARTAGFTCADLAALCKDAALMALRNHLASAGPAAADKLPPVTAENFEETLGTVFKRRGMI